MSNHSKDLKNPEEENIKLQTNSENLKDKESESQNKIETLKKKIHELENENKALLETKKNFEAKKEYIGFLEEEISRMEEIIDDLQTSIQNLKEEKKIMAKSFEESDIQEIEVKRPISEIRRACPKCGNTNPSQIREMIDKTNIISDYPKVYGKKYQCGQCGTEWSKT